jgi:1,4-alpha-glucan branching enzyme
MAKGYLSLVLHAHLPFIRHPEHDVFLEENWFFEAITDTYIPLIKVFDSLLEDNIDFHITLSLSPPLIHMMRDDLLGSRYLRHLDRTIELCSKEIERTKNDADLNALAKMYFDRYSEAREIFDKKYGRDLTKAFKKFYEAGKVELITCCGTHGFLPMMDMYKPAIRAQVKTAVDTFKETFGDIPKGIWLPECAYHPGHDAILGEFGIKYFFVETHGVLFGSPRPKYGVYSPYLCESGVAVLARDLESSKAVWSSKEGYPGDYNYREYYRDIGFDLEYDYIKPYINDCGTRVNTGIKYHKITGESSEKGLYNRQAALDAAASHAGNFMFNREKQVEHLEGMMDRAPIIVSPYDAELFGHWWFEGPEWLNFLLRKIHCDQDKVKTITPGAYLEMYDKHPVITPSMSTWGHKGYNEVWLDGANDWIYKHLHKMAELMTKAADEYNDPSDMERRVLNQMAREVLLAQSSDWAFIMQTGTFVEYAVNRTKEHIGRFLEFNAQLRRGKIDKHLLEQAEGKYNIFESIDYKVYANK